MQAERRKVRRVKVGSLTLGESFIPIQSMTNTEPHDFPATLRQTRALADAGCDIVRITVPDPEAAGVFRYLKENGIRVPLVADIHFDYKSALAAVEAGADKIRLNPGNIGSEERVRAVVDACRERSVPIRIGVNSGSLEKDLLIKYGAPTAEALADSALGHARILEKSGFFDTVLSVKSSDVQTMIAANRILASRCDYPIHLGVTEAGARTRALVKSSIGIGTLLAEGIGDTLRVSLTEDPVEEVAAAKEILRALSLTENPGLNIVSCPTCGRTKIDLIPLVAAFERRVREEKLEGKNLTVALMGCAVNGPGEAREADFGIAGGRGEGLLFRKGEILCKLPEDRLLDALIDEIRRA